MSVPRSVAEVMRDHVTLEVEGIDRLYLNVFIPKLQYESGVVGFFRNHRGYTFASLALMDPITQDFIRQVSEFTAKAGIPLITFSKGERKDDVMKEHLAKFQGREGVLFVGKAQEKTPVFRTEKRRNPETGQAARCVRRPPFGSELSPRALDGLPNKVLAAEYRAALPDEQLLADELKATRKLLESRK